MRIYTNVVVSKVTNNKQYFILKRIFFYLHKIIKVKHTQPVHLLYHITSADLMFWDIRNQLSTFKHDRSSNMEDYCERTMTFTSMFKAQAWND